MRTECRVRALTLFMTETPAFLTGRLLLAMPGMADPRFEHAVILVVAHDEDGALGIGVGHERGDIDLVDLVESLEISSEGVPSAPVHHGGPVDLNRGFVIHSRDWGGQDSVDIANLCRMTVTQDVFRAIGEGGGPSSFLVALGYAGWSGGQLEEEMTRHGWFVTDATPSILFDTPAQLRWAEAFRLAGVDPALLSARSGQA